MTHWPKDQYGEFYNGDSYIILNTFKEPGNEVNAALDTTVQHSPCTNYSNYKHRCMINCSVHCILLCILQELKYDLHFWIGQYSTQDEYGTAAYKTVELDTLVSHNAPSFLYHSALTLSYSLMTSQCSIVK